MRKAAGVLIVNKTEKETFILAVQSTWRKGWSLPCGGVDPGEDARQAAIRECAEEIGALVSLCSDEPFVRFEGDTQVTIFRAKLIGDVRGGPFQMKSPSPTEISKIGWVSPICFGPNAPEPGDAYPEFNEACLRFFGEK